MSESYLQREQRSDGAKLRTRPSDSSIANSNPICSHHLPVFLVPHKVGQQNLRSLEGETRTEIPGKGERPARIGKNVTLLPFPTLRRQFLNSGLRTEIASYRMQGRQKEIK